MLYTARKEWVPKPIPVGHHILWYAVQTLINFNDLSSIRLEATHFNAEPETHNYDDSRLMSTP